MDIPGIHREITPLTEADCFVVLDRKKKIFGFPLHFHPEYELNLMINGKGVERIVGDSIEYINNKELVFVGPNLVHAWSRGKATNENIHEITIQFHRDIFHESLLNRNIMYPIKEMFKRSSRGILFSPETIDFITNRIVKLIKKSSIDLYIDLTNILFDLACSRNQIILSTNTFKNEDFYNSDKIKKVYEYVQQNYSNKIKVEDVAEMLNMSLVTFSRLMKLRTLRTFVEFLNDIRLGHATRWLLESDMNIAEIAYKSGFNNLGYFNKVFKKAKGCTPSEFKGNYNGIKRFS
ncbi:MAG: helix-turn-helix domain-containing protein [Bacteroidales bacterium]|nr:helix-turn-helix domain-containing protein [Bacteroidales bacterium]